MQNRCTWSVAVTFYGARLNRLLSTQKPLVINLISNAAEGPDEFNQFAIAGTVAVVELMEKQAEQKGLVLPVISDDVMKAFQRDVDEEISQTVAHDSLDVGISTFLDVTDKYPEDDKYFMHHLRVVALGRSTQLEQLGFLMGAVDTYSYFQKADNAEKLRRQFEES